MREVIEKRIVKDSTNSSAMTMVVASLAASLSGPMVCYGFDENQICQPLEFYNAKTASNQELEESVKRIVSYTEENYKEPNKISIIENKTADIKFFELSNQFSEKQIDLDTDIQFALNQFGRILGEKIPKKNRF